MNDVKLVLKSQGFYDDFRNGLNPEIWNISEGVWGGENVNNGVIAENVLLSDRQTLILRARGDYSNHLKRTGAVICSKKLFGPGKYSVCMKIAPRLGVCSAFWTFYYEDEGKINHEIDIELPGNKQSKEIGFDKVLNTNWISEKEHFESKSVAIPSVNDNQFHVYSFEWHTNPKEIIYYLDGKMTSRTTNFVPTHKGVLNVGVWFPNQWCGSPLFEEDYMEVKWIAYEPFDEPSIEKQYQKDKMAHPDQFPKKSCEIKRNFLANGDFSSSLGWKGNIEAVFNHRANLNHAWIYQCLEIINPEVAYQLRVCLEKEPDDLKVIITCYQDDLCLNKQVCAIENMEETSPVFIHPSSNRIELAIDSRNGYNQMKEIMFNYQEE